MAQSGAYVVCADRAASFRNGLLGPASRMRRLFHTLMSSFTTEPRSTPSPEHREGPVARTIEQQTAKLPSDAFLWAAVGSMGLSLVLQATGKKQAGNFIGQWAPTLLIFGLYNKMVKLHGSDPNTSGSMSSGGIMGSSRSL